jgi:hypothetical protein
MPDITCNALGQKIPRQTIGVASELSLTVRTSRQSGTVTLQIVPLANVLYHSSVGQAVSDGLTIQGGTQGLTLPVNADGTFYLYSAAGTTVDILVVG